jgi:hypothetical protein
MAALTVAARRGAAYTPEPLGVMRIHGGGFLASTQADAPAMESIIERIREQGPKMDGNLFAPAFLDRAAHRFRFTTVRALRGVIGQELIQKYSGMRGAALRWVTRVVPSGFISLRVFLVFLILRPFDVMPTFWFRVAKAAVVLGRARRQI